MSKKKITLQSSDVVLLEIDQVVANQFQTIKQLIEDDCASSVIPLPIVSSKTLSEVIQYCKKHAETSSKFCVDGTAANELRNWDAEFVKVDQATLFDLLPAANYLDVKSLLDLTCMKVAAMIKKQVSSGGTEDIQHQK